MRTAARVDENQASIVLALRKLGASVISLAPLGKGVPDLLVGYRGQNHLVEVKDGNKSPSKQKLTTDQVVFHKTYRGKIQIMRSVDDALAWLDEIGRVA